jgi:hypothetical protein
MTEGEKKIFWEKVEHELKEQKEHKKNGWIESN